MAAASMREMGSDEDMDDSDTEDPDLLVSDLGGGGGEETIMSLHLTC